ncbi:MAG: hypothetical protein IJ152_01850 [Bacteroidales bacterium]|nr:hypothetical protein [Bacteroidales bacterium]
MNSLVFSFSDAYGKEGFLQWLQKEADAVRYLDFRALEGCCCYCDESAREAIEKALEGPLPRLRWLDSGDYHYLSYLLAKRQKDPFHLVLLDNHPDNQEPAFGGVLSCGGWVKEARDRLENLRDILTVGPEGCEKTVSARWVEARRGEKVYVSLDKDIMRREYARTDWSQGEYGLEDVKRIMALLMDNMEVVAVDVCGEMAPSKGATGEDLRINMETNKELYNFITNHF